VVPCRRGTAAMGGLRVAFCHPDLGLGAAELAARRPQVAAVDVWTAFYDPNRAFEETRGSGGFGVHVAGGWFPRSIFGRAMALCAYVRCCLVALAIAFRCWAGRGYDVVIADQVSAVVPVLLALTRARVVFYCHFPDQLLAAPSSAAHRLYRAPLDWLEETTTGMAHRVLVNSEFTKGVFAETFSRLHRRGLQPAVLYPAVAIPSEEALQEAKSRGFGGFPEGCAEFLGASGALFVSINRFERKKGLSLALRALAEVKQTAPRSSAAAAARLIMAGGYDSRLPENVDHLDELRKDAQELGLQAHVFFLPSFSDNQRSVLLARATVVLYTPENEHFGIVPLEAMAARCPVIACDSGGPRESIGKAGAGSLPPGGLLCEPTPAAFARAMTSLMEDPSLAEAMGERARARVSTNFSRRAFGERLLVEVDLVAGECNLQMSPLDS